jgi:Zn-dependent M32 family carboxypeptidase
MYTTYSIRTIYTITYDSPRQRRIDDVKKAFASTMGKKDISPVTGFRKRIFKVSLEGGIVHEYNASKEEHKESIQN